MKIEDFRGYFFTFFNVLKNNFNYKRSTNKLATESVLHKRVSRDILHSNVFIRVVSIGWFLVKVLFFCVNYSGN